MAVSGIRLHRRRPVFLLLALSAVLTFATLVFLSGRWVGSEVGLRTAYPDDRAISVGLAEDGRSLSVLVPESVFAGAGDCPSLDLVTSEHPDSVELQVRVRWRKATPCIGEVGLLGDTRLLSTVLAAPLGSRQLEDIDGGSLSYFDVRKVPVPHPSAHVRLARIGTPWVTLDQRLGPHGQATYAVGDSGRTYLLTASLKPPHAPDPDVRTLPETVGGRPAVLVPTYADRWELRWTLDGYWLALGPGTPGEPTATAADLVAFADTVN